MLASKLYKEIYSTSCSFYTTIVKETLEVLEAVCKGDWYEAELEFRQVLCGLQMQLFRFTKRDFELKWCDEVIANCYARRVVWLKIFKEAQVEFKPEYLVGGANHRRPHKIKDALALAGIHINEKTAVMLCEKYFYETDKY